MRRLLLVAALCGSAALSTPPASAGCAGGDASRVCVEVDPTTGTVCIRAGGAFWNTIPVCPPPLVELLEPIIGS